MDQARALSFVQMVRFVVRRLVGIRPGHQAEMNTLNGDGVGVT
jgi:hypothetical protein